MMYGVECTGIADTALKRTIGLAAAAIAPPAMGKNARLTLHAAARLHLRGSIVRCACYPHQSLGNCLVG